MKKRQTASTTREAAAMIKRAGIRLTAYVLLGGPAETAESAATDRRTALRTCRPLAAASLRLDLLR